MLKKSLLVATLLIPNMFGADELSGADSSTDPSTGSPADFSTESSIDSSMFAEDNNSTEVVDGRSVPYLYGKAHILQGDKKTEEAKELYRLVLSKSRGSHEYDNYLPKCYLELSRLGDVNRALRGLKNLIKDPSVAADAREGAIDSLYLIGALSYAEAREMWANLQVEKGQIATIKVAREVAKDMYPEKAAANHAR